MVLGQTVFPAVAVFFRPILSSLLKEIYSKFISLVENVELMLAG